MNSCKLCKLTLSSIDDEHLEELELWQATLPVTIWADEQEPHMFRVYRPTSDPRPEAEVCDPTPDMNYAWIIIQVQIQEVPDHESLCAHEISSLSTVSDETFSQINAWLQSCKFHKACTDGSTLLCHSVKTMPTRLLDLAPGHAHPNVKLVDTAQGNLGNISYATLSHCWGSTLTVQLLRSLVEDYSVNIPWTSLSRTFQDAIVTALKLDIQYLWIDALCIVQDDNDDWTYEAARMVNVYSNSYLNITADASSDGTEGLFRQRYPDRLRSFIVPHQKSAADHRGSVFYTERWWSSIYCSPLADRAWTVQEKFLAPRGLHFAGEEVHWECMELFTAENLPVLFNTVPTTNYIIRKSSLRFDSHAQYRRQSVYRIWYQLVSAYSSGSLTFTSDRPIAISGLAHIFCRLLELPDSDYLCGMWRPQLEKELMWSNQGTWSIPPQNLRVESLPSWSWLSLCTPIWIYGHILVGGRNTEGLITAEDLITAEVVQASTMPCRDAFGAVSSGEVTLRVPLCLVTIQKGKYPFYDERSDFSHIIDVGGSLLREEEHFQFRPDDSTDNGMLQILNTQVYLMLGRSSVSKGTGRLSDRVEKGSQDQSRTLEESRTKLSLLEGKSYECLILKEASRFGHFRQVGYIHFEPARFTWSAMSNEQAEQFETFARRILYEQFTHGNIPNSVCARPDHAGLYTITLV